MGIEYRLQLAFPDAAAVEPILRRLSMVHESDGAKIGFEFRAAENTGAMPDAMAHVEPDGLYFCNFGGKGEEFLGVVIASLVSHFGAVTVADLEL